MRAWKHVVMEMLRAIHTVSWVNQQVCALSNLEDRHPFLKRACKACLMARSTTGSQSKGPTDPIQFSKDPEKCKHKSCAENENPIKRYNHKGVIYEACGLCGSRWVVVGDHRIQVPANPAPGKAPKVTAKKYLGDMVMWFGTHKNVKMAGLPEHYLQWAKRQIKNDIGGDLAYVAAYALVAGIKDAPGKPGPPQPPSRSSQRSEASSSRSVLEPKSKKRGKPTDKPSKKQEERYQINTESEKEDSDNDAEKDQSDRSWNVESVATLSTDGEMDL